jgi:hypothetical protein
MENSVIYIDIRNNSHENINNFDNNDYDFLRNLFFSAEPDKNVQRKDFQKRFSKNTILIAEELTTDDNKNRNLIFFQFY